MFFSFVEHGMYSCQIIELHSGMNADAHHMGSTCMAGLHLSSQNFSSIISLVPIRHELFFSICVFVIPLLQMSLG